MSFEICNLYAPEHAEFLPHKNVKEGDGVQLQLNLDLITLEWIDEFEKFFFEWSKEQNTKFKKSKTAKSVAKEKAEETATAPENDFDESADYFEGFESMRFDIRYKAMYLGGRPGETDPRKRVIDSWDLVDKNGQPVPVGFETISSFSRPLVDKLHAFCRDFVTVEKKSEETSAAIS